MEFNTSGNYKPFEKGGIMEKSFRTKNCIFCSQPATSWCGHVHSYEGMITAGVCNKHDEYRDRILFAEQVHFALHEELKENEYLCQGCFGAWKERYGLEETTYTPKSSKFVLEEPELYLWMEH